jgi:hypothetical protein
MRTNLPKSVLFEAKSNQCFVCLRLLYIGALRRLFTRILSLFADMREADYNAEITNYTYHGIETIHCRRFSRLRQYAYVHYAHRFDDVRRSSKLKGYDIWKSWNRRSEEERQIDIQTVRQHLIAEVVARNNMVMMIARRQLGFIPPVPQSLPNAPNAQIAPNPTNAQQQPAVPNPPNAPNPTRKAEPQTSDAEDGEEDEEEEEEQEQEVIVTVHEDKDQGMPDDSMQNRDLLPAWSTHEYLSLDNELTYRPVRVLYDSSGDGNEQAMVTTILLCVGVRTSDNQATDVSPFVPS